MKRKWDGHLRPHFGPDRRKSRLQIQQVFEAFFKCFFGSFLKSFFEPFFDLRETNVARKTETIFFQNIEPNFCEIQKFSANFSNFFEKLAKIFEPFFDLCETNDARKSEEKPLNFLQTKGKALGFPQIKEKPLDFLQIKAKTFGFPPNHRKIHEK